MVELMTLLNKLNERELSIYNTEVQSKKKSTGLAYVLWFFLGLAGIHKAYLGEGLMCFLYLCMGIGGPFLLFLTWIPLGVMLLIDAFTLPGQVSNANDQVGKDVAVKIINSRPPV